MPTEGSEDRWELEAGVRPLVKDKKGNRNYDLLSTPVCLSFYFI